MLFSQAYHEMVNKRAKIKLPSWDGYWEWDRNIKCVMNCIKGNRTRVSCDTLGVMFNIPTDKWIIINEENKEMENTYVTNNLTCKAVQLKDIEDIDSFNEDVRKSMKININDYALSNIPKPILKSILVIQVQGMDLEKSLFMNEGDYLVNIPLFKFPIVIRKEVFEKVFKKVEG